MVLQEIPDTAIRQQVNLSPDTVKSRTGTADEGEDSQVYLEEERNILSLWQDTARLTSGKVKDAFV